MKNTSLAAFAASLVLSASAWAQSFGGGMGPGMMGGDGHGMMDGPGMMGRYGLGWGADVPGLSKEQRDKIWGIQKELRQKQWALMDKMHDEFESQRPYRDGKFDEQAARKAYDASEKLHRQMFENALDARKRIDGLLTPQQREQMQRAWGGK